MVDTSSFAQLSDLKEYPQGEPIIALAQEAREFVLSHTWALEVLDIRFAGGFDYCAVFYVELLPRDADRFIWVIVGDIPPIYLDTSVTTASEALQAYLELVEDWCDAVDKGEDITDLIPILTRTTFDPIEPNADVINQLRGRTEFLRQKLLPLLREDENV